MTAGFQAVGFFFCHYIRFGTRQSKVLTFTLICDFLLIIYLSFSREISRAILDGHLKRSLESYRSLLATGIVNLIDVP